MDCQIHGYCTYYQTCKGIWPTKNAFRPPLWPLMLVTSHKMSIYLYAGIEIHWVALWENLRLTLETIIFDLKIVSLPADRLKAMEPDKPKLLKYMTDWTGTWTHKSGDSTNEIHQHLVVGCWGLPCILKIYFAFAVELITWSPCRRCRCAHVEMCLKPLLRIIAAVLGWKPEGQGGQRVNVSIQCHIEWMPLTAIECHCSCVATSIFVFDFFGSPLYPPLLGFSVVNGPGSEVMPARKRLRARGGFSCDWRLPMVKFVSQLGGLFHIQNCFIVFPKMGYPAIPNHHESSIFNHVHRIFHSEPASIWISPVSVGCTWGMNHGEVTNEGPRVFVNSILEVKYGAHIPDLLGFHVGFHSFHICLDMFGRSYFGLCLKFKHGWYLQIAHLNLNG